MALEVATELDAQDKQVTQIKSKRTLMELENTKICPICSSEMKLRTSKHGDFYGCMTFPICRGIISIEKRGTV